MKRFRYLETADDRKDQIRRASRCRPSSTGCHLLSDQAMRLYSIKRSARNSRFSVLGNTFQGQKHGCKNFEISISAKKARSFDPTF